MEQSLIPTEQIVFSQEQSKSKQSGTSEDINLTKEGKHNNNNNSDSLYLNSKRNRISEITPASSIKLNEDNNDLLDYDRYNKDYKNNSNNNNNNNNSHRTSLIHKKRISSKRHLHSKIIHHSHYSDNINDSKLQEHINKYLVKINSNKNQINTVCPFCNWIKKELISFHSFYELLFYAKNFYDSPTSSLLFGSKSKSTSTTNFNKENYSKVKNDFESFFNNINPISSQDKEIKFEESPLIICEECLELKLSESIVFLHEIQLKKSSPSKISTNTMVMNTHSLVDNENSPYTTINKVYEFIKDFTQEMAKIQVNIEFIVKKLNDAVKNSNDKEMKENCQNLQGYSNNASIIIERLNNDNEIWKKEWDEIFSKNNNNLNLGNNNNGFANSLNNLLNSNALLKKIYEQLMQLNQINNNDSINLFNALSIGNNILNNALSNIGKMPQLNNNLNLANLMNSTHIPFQQDNKDNNLLLNMLSQLKTGTNASNNNNNNQSQNASTQCNTKGTTFDKSDNSKTTNIGGTGSVNDLLNLLKTTSTTNNSTASQQQGNNGSNNSNTSNNNGINQPNLGILSPQMLPGLLHPLLLNQLLQAQLLRNNNNINNTGNNNNNSSSNNNNGTTLPFQQPFPLLPFTTLPFTNNLLDPSANILNNFMLNGGLGLPNQNNILNTLSTLINLNDLNLAATTNINSPLGMNMNLNSLTNNNPLLNLRNLQNMTQNTSSNQNVNFNKK